MTYAATKLAKELFVADLFGVAVTLGGSGIGIWASEECWREGEEEGTKQLLPVDLVAAVGGESDLGSADIPIFPGVPPSASVPVVGPPEGEVTEGISDDGSTSEGPPEGEVSGVTRDAVSGIGPSEDEVTRGTSWGGVGVEDGH